MALKHPGGLKQGRQFIHGKHGGTWEVVSIREGMVRYRSVKRPLPVVKAPIDYFLNTALLRWSDEATPGSVDVKRTESRFGGDD